MTFPQKPVFSLLVASLLLGGCMSSERMTRISPLSEEDGARMSSERTNAWPIYYNAGTGISVLWPFMDFDKDGWALRPFYAENKDERSVLWPLSGWDKKGGWALTGYWDKACYGVFPLLHVNKSENSGLNWAFPFWWESDWSDWGLFPFGGIGKTDWRLLNFYYRDNDDGNYWNFWPLFYRESDTAKQNVDWRLLYYLGGYQSAPEETASWLLPLYFYSNDKKGEKESRFTWVFPTFWQKSNSQNYVNSLIPFYYYEKGTPAENGCFISLLGDKGVNPDSWRFLNFYYRNSPDYAHWNFWPFLSRKSDVKNKTLNWRLLGGLLGGSRSNDKQSSSWLVPFFYHQNSNDRTKTWVLPTFFATSDSDSSTHTFLPFYYWHSTKDNRLFASLFGGFGDSRSGKHFRNFLGPLYINYENPSQNYSFFSVFWPLYVRERDGETRFERTFPFGSRWTNGDESRRNFLLGLGASRTRDDKTSWAVWPFYGTLNDFANGDFRYWLTLAGAENNADETQNSHWFFPFYSYARVNEKTTRSNFLLGLGATHSYEDENSWALWPFYGTCNDFDNADFRYWLTLAGSDRNADGTQSSHWLFPLYHHTQLSEKESRNHFLLGLGASHTCDDKTSWTAWPFYGFRNNFADADFRYWLTLAGRRKNACYDSESNWFFPFYHYESSEKGHSLALLCYLFQNRYHEYENYSSHSNYFFPFYFYESGTHRYPDGKLSAEPWRQELMIPFIYGFENDRALISGSESREHWALFNLLNFKDKSYTPIPLVKNATEQSLATKSTQRIVNAIWETRDFACWKDGVFSEYEQQIIEFALVLHHGWHPRGCVHMRSREKFTPNTLPEKFDKEIFGTETPYENSGWMEIDEKRKAFARKELTEILKNKGIEVPDGADDTFFIRALQAFAATHSEIFTEKEFEVWPFYEALDDAFGGYEKEFLWGLWYSRGNEEESFTSCMKYLYRRETTKEGTKLDVFPFISVDTGKRGAFSFLGNFFKIVNDDEKGWSGNFLFIPWGDDSED